MAVSRLRATGMIRRTGSARVASTEQRVESWGEAIRFLQRESDRMKVNIRGEPFRMRCGHWRRPHGPTGVGILMTIWKRDIQ